MKIHRYGGFTTWDLLAVLIILLFVTAILFPVFMRARNVRPGHSSCQANLKQIGLGFSQYGQDYAEEFPAIGRVNSKEDSGWAKTLQPYLKSTRLFQCPSDPNFPYNNSPSKTRFTSYYFNARLNKKALSKIKNIETVILMGDGRTASSNYSCYSFDLCVGLTDDGLAGSVPKEGKARHLEGANYAFADGHVRWLKPSQVQVQPSRNAGASFAFLPYPN